MPSFSLCIGILYYSKTDISFYYLVSFIFSIFKLVNSVEFNGVNIIATTYDIIVTAISTMGLENSQLQFVRLENVTQAFLYGTNCLSVVLAIILFAEILMENHE